VPRLFEKANAQREETKQGSPPGCETAKQPRIAQARQTARKPGDKFKSLRFTVALNAVQSLTALMAWTLYLPFSNLTTRTQPTRVLWFSAGWNEFSPRWTVKQSSGSASSKQVAGFQPRIYNTYSMKPSWAPMAHPYHHRPDPSRVAVCKGGWWFLKAHAIQGAALLLQVMEHRAIRARNGDGRWAHLQHEDTAHITWGETS